MAINQPCYVTRAEVRRALDVKQAAYNDAQIDRQLVAATDSSETLCGRVFYPADATRKFDWPDGSLSYSWRLWLNQNELAAQPTVVMSGTTVITSANYILYPNTGPPFRSLQLSLNGTAAFGAGLTSQNDISITGTFGYWAKTLSIGALAAAITTTTQAQITVNAAADAGVGVGDVLICDSERMLVTDTAYVTTGISFSAGVSTASANDNQITVPDGTQFFPGEEIRIDFEWMLILDIVGNILLVKRAWSGATLTTHSPTAIFARRQLTVQRGALGTTATTHLIAAPLSISFVPGLIKELSLAEALVGLTQEPAAYAQSSFAGWYGQNSRTEGQQREPGPGVGMADLRIRAFAQYGRVTRQRVV